MLSNRIRRALSFTLMMGCSGPADSLDSECSTSILRPSYDYSAQLFGSSIALDGHYAVIGDPWNGVVSIFKENSGVWELSQVVGDPDPLTTDELGRAVALSSGLMAAGAPGHRKEDGVMSGRAVVYQLSNGVFAQSQILVPSAGDELDGFGTSIAVSQDLIAVGAPGHSSETAPPGAGAVYLFGRSLSGWEHVQTIYGPEVNGAFGGTLSLSGDLLAVGAPDALSGGYVAVLRRWDSQFVETGIVHGRSYGFTAGDRFGIEIELSDGRILVGASRRRSFSSGQILPIEGFVYLGSIDHEGKVGSFDVLASATDTPYLGVSLGLNGNTAVIGIPIEDARARIDYFTYSAGDWSRLCSFDAPGETLATDGHSLLMSNVGEATATIVPTPGGGCGCLD